MSARPAAVFLISAAICILHALLTDRVVDDSYIIFRYARNWAAGFGPVFNPGERVEGYTSFLWTALLAGIHRLEPGIDLLHAAQAVSLLCALTILFLVTRRSWNPTPREAEGGWPRALPPLLLALNTPFVVWSTGGLETQLYSLLVLASALAEWRALARGSGFWAAPLLLALATMTRPDGVFFLAALGIFRLGPGQGSRPSRLWRAAGSLWPFFLLYTPYWLWRFHYYGWPLANTFYVKAGGGFAQTRRGLLYLLDWIWPEGLGLLLLSAPLTPWRNPRWRLFTLYIAGGLCFVVLAGGESLGFYRFLVPLLPLLALMAGAGAAELIRLRGRLDGKPSPRFAVPRWLRLRGAAAVLALFSATASFRPTLNMLLCPFQPAASEAAWKAPPGAVRRLLGGSGPEGDQGVPAYSWFDNYFVDRLSLAGRWLDRHAPGDALVASTPIGSLGYAMRQPLLDMLGLTDTHIAHVPVPGMGAGRAGHEKGDGRYVLSRRPRFILLDNVAVFDHPLSDAEVARGLRLRSEHEIWDDPEFHRLYRKRMVELDETDLAPIAPERRRFFHFFTFYERLEPEESEGAATPPPSRPAPPGAAPAAAASAPERSLPGSGRHRAAR